MENVYLLIGMDTNTMKVGSIKVFANLKEAETSKNELNNLMSKTDIVYIIENHKVQ